MTNWFHRKHAAKAKACTECGKATVRTSGLCRDCEREEQQRSADAQRGFSIELSEYVRVPIMLHDKTRSLGKITDGPHILCRRLLLDSVPFHFYQDLSHRKYTRLQHQH